MYVVEIDKVIWELQEYICPENIPDYTSSLSFISEWALQGVVWIYLYFLLPKLEKKKQIHI